MPAWQCQYRPMLASQSSASIILILVNPWHKIAGQCITLCWAACLLPVCLILVQPRPKTARQCITYVRSCVSALYYKIANPRRTDKMPFGEKKSGPRRQMLCLKSCFFLAFYLYFNKSSHGHSLSAIPDLPTQLHDFRAVRQFRLCSSLSFEVPKVNIVTFSLLIIHC